MDDIYHPSSFRIRTAELKVKPHWVFIDEAEKPPQKRAHIVCLWLPEETASANARVFEQVKDWVNHFFDCTSPGSELTRKYSYTPRLAVAAPPMPEELEQMLVKRYIRVMLSRHGDDAVMVAERLRKLLRTEYFRLCNPKLKDYPIELRRHRRTWDTTEESEGVPIEEIIAAQYPEKEREGYRQAVRELLAPYKNWTERVKSKPWEIDV